ncbi:MAG: redoxin domain-containing protein [Nitrospinaceae bacterium]|nr:thioredoxin family protein [Nitrospinaceae bacterium]NIR56076.1 thioredoxin family protein [Nitrospinaceae bacterium]NIS86521.1 thioredoxin family protein [Nitrospinaceae bacterium]NIT83359.1 thioredoxin family protein [Nitrospinaceae bacterium]NIU45565.1 thioredoxin family protein [Nitrospinaceae bacterium]
MPALESTMVPLGTPAPDFSLPGTDGKTYSLMSFGNMKVLVIIFMCNHCPYVQAVLRRLINLQQEYADKSVQLVGINVNDAVKYPEDSPEKMKELVEKKKLPFPYLFDATQATAKAYDAVCTPDIYVYGIERTLRYRGRIDDNWQHPDEITRHDLKDAIEALLADETVNPEQFPSMGCSIKWKE